MSLELFSPLFQKINEDIANNIFFLLEDECNYREVYISEYGGHGFINNSKCYNENEPPLFEISISDNTVVLSVFGDLNDQRIIKEQVSDIFHKNEIFIDFVEE
ncbi:hypothetical protein DUD99_23025 [Salmonella enterica subsp. enterica]|uniref:Uncharacterized protein n=1 Tax=Salmonella montevideo TaxID=115981 RepID=A0A624B2U6_SALMO|nr:hypothetical protein [Salmonella enterica]EAC2144616.1 hypothetical protein [Salmonella enterica subsp. enterica]ECZ5261219.1 hypothetical protein [Salmonella enterica subsp. enterica serovar Montevideo]EDR2628300.1 hypothetical protein [Salmonella enterica subsp. enterica serovar Thompson]EAQ6074653.1 hypothetical protein [Salmonella enterica]